LRDIAKRLYVPSRGAAMLCGSKGAGGVTEADQLSSRNYVTKFSLESRS
jgi:hypothetical protein